MNRSSLSFFAMVALVAGVSVAGTLAYAEGKSIAGIVFQQDQYMRGVQIGMERATAQSGDQLLSANSDSKLEKESRLIDT